MIYGTYRASSGAAKLTQRNGCVIDLASANAREITALRRDDIAFVTQFFHGLPRVPAIELVAGPLRAQGWNRDAARCIAREWLDKLRVPRGLWDLPPAFFSGGECQRVNLARSFARRARLLLLDEPTASLDADASHLVSALINDLKAEGRAIVAIFHDPEFIDAYTDFTVEVHPHHKDRAY